jgi:transcriptional regulator with XRE-family HTH domain
MYTDTERPVPLRRGMLSPIISVMHPGPDDTALYSLLGRRIAEARLKRSAGPWSQSQLAAAVGLTRGSIANIELATQRPPLHVLWAIGDALGIEPRSLVPTTSELAAHVGHGWEAVESEPDVRRLVDAFGGASPQLEAWIAEAQSHLRGQPVRPRVAKRSSE